MLSASLSPFAMRIAVSGTHGSGKTTLIEAFVARHPEYAYEPEPYTVLSEIHGEQFAAEPSVEDFERQLEFHVETLARYEENADVVFERAPVDFLAYMLAIADRDDAIETVREALTFLDVVVFLPLDARAPIDVGADEDLELRAAVDEGLRDILLDDAFGLFSEPRPVVIEARGSVQQRVAAIETAIARVFG